MAKVVVKNLYEYMKKVVLIWIGFCFLVIGIVGLIFPVIPGIVFLFLGMVFVGRASNSFRESYYIKLIHDYVKKKLQAKKGALGRLASFL